MFYVLFGVGCMNFCIILWLLWSICVDISNHFTEGKQLFYGNLCFVLLEIMSIRYVLCYEDWLS